ncbi:MAG: biopolymer transporter ExbD [Flavobacterium sp.]|jgi:biopolymer transport protein ExbD|uniref:ExbD/TolR family protein n=1 Tax=unclassified Flavobacterium TaxID=196869 RepID=UPI000C17D8B0|nr:MULTISPECIES: biopolymer transporter ExbD [unclassified Flavobacterium]MDP3679292.1 biopolymer transporter ExbD [Flavobacterium sp.]MDZ4330710.1 biopolymer transporter ExbD [Flavobacterium sp.]PIF60852.1 outer membrane transport energization protein ExbD [Flavobacterium sp. 11]RKS13152.1 outer membrane transport energization protein ExbD [Flavobacterium sp. 120]WKL45240.1 biopolymer transporter ExbD [Flavobacterium sp. ZE23DGlu08]
MAELNTGDGDGKKGGKVRSKKANSKVDLTAMVDLAFLLITFFMLTTTLSKPQSMPLGLPDKEDDPTDKPIKVDENRTLTVLLGDNDKMVYYMGLLATPIAGPKDISYGKEGIRKELLKRKQSVVEYTGNKDKGLIVIIKPSKKSNYRNLVDILDEMAIVGVPSNAIVNDFSPEELKLLEGK